jgi:hypothetical protein
MRVSAEPSASSVRLFGSASVSNRTSSGDARWRCKVKPRHYRGGAKFAALRWYRRNPPPDAEWGFAQKRQNTPSFRGRGPRACPNGVSWGLREPLVRGLDPRATGLTREAGRGQAPRRTRKPYSRGQCSWIPGCRAPLGPRNDELLGKAAEWGKKGTDGRVLILLLFAARDAGRIAPQPRNGSGFSRICNLHARFLCKFPADADRGPKPAQSQIVAGHRKRDGRARSVLGVSEATSSGHAQR